MSVIRRSGAGRLGEQLGLPEKPPDPSAAMALRLLEQGLTVRRVPQAPASGIGALHRTVARRSGPLLCSGLLDSWPARTAWSPAALVERHGERRVTALLDLPDTGVLFPQDQRRYERELSFGEFVEQMESAGSSAPCYLAYQRAHEIFDPADCDFASLVPPDGHPTDTRVWIGSAGTRSMLHSDLKDNFFCQLWGEKSVTLLAWRDSRAAYPFPDNLVNSQVDLAVPDMRRFPRLKHAVLHHVRMGPGDLLYIPRGWWHDIRAHTTSVSVNHWFGRPLGVAQYLALLGALGPEYWKATARDFIEHGLLRRTESTQFFFSPPSTGKRLYDALRFGDFSRGNDPSSS
ncbi:cupin-like domain-containing protein [Streptomyces chattanoogensis]|uniref:cupin-like domain-containing protein n=1 Tax=Streptomyces chattanoogensis TaxID=66876 RepID=UPI000AE954F3|nr:cupin-like domain-containing protein [Streptomyces chattanoogensis]